MPVFAPNKCIYSDCVIGQNAPEFSPNSFPGLSPTRPTGNEVEFSLLKDSFETLKT